MVNDQKVVVAGFDRLQVAVISETGVMLGGALALANGSDSGMLKLDAAQNAGPQLGEPQLLQIEGDNEVKYVFQFPPNTLPVFDAQVGTFDFAFRALAEGTTVVDEGDLSMLLVQPEAPDYPNFCALLTQNAGIRDTGKQGQAGYSHLLVMNGLAAPLDTDTIQTGANASSDRIRFTGQKTDVAPWGETLTSQGFGKNEAAAIRITSRNRMSMHVLMGDGTEDTIILDYAPVDTSGAKVQIWVDGTKAVYTTDYTVTSSTVTFEAGSIPGAGEAAVVLYEHA